MDIVVGLVGSAFIGYIVNKLEKMESKIDLIEAEVITIKMYSRKRRDDFPEDV